MYLCEVTLYKYKWSLSSLKPRIRGGGLQPGLPTQPLCSSLMEATLYCHVCHMLLFHTSQDSLWIDSSFILIVIRAWPIMHLSFFVHKPRCVHHPFNIMVRYSAERIVCCCLFFFALLLYLLRSWRQNLFYTFSGSAFCASLTFFFFFLTFTHSPSSALISENVIKLLWRMKTDGKAVASLWLVVLYAGLHMFVCLLNSCQYAKLKLKMKSERVNQHGPASPTRYCNTFVKCRFKRMASRSTVRVF